MDAIRRIMIDKDKCVGCDSCTLACIVEHDLEKRSIYDIDFSSNASMARLHLEQNQYGEVIPMICRQCEEAECAQACISGAMAKDSKTDIILHDKSRCVNCLMCIMACPYGVLQVNLKNNSILKCDMCISTRGPDGIPACVEACPTGAIRLEEFMV